MQLQYVKKVHIYIYISHSVYYTQPAEVLNKLKVYYSQHNHQLANCVRVT